MEYWETKEFKQRKVMELQSINLDEYDLQPEGETRLLEYITANHDYPEDHNVFEILAVLRFLKFMRKYVFRYQKIKNFALLYETLKFSGLAGRRSYRLTPVQYFQFAAIKGFYEWVDTDIEPKAAVISETLRIHDGKIQRLRRLTRDAVLFIPRKFSKTTSVAALAVDELLFGDNNAQVYCAANAYKQAKLCFDEISKCIRPFDINKKRFKFTRETINWREGNDMAKESKIECLTGGAAAKDGLAASLVLFDEMAAAKYTKDHSDAAELLQVLTSSMGIRWEPLTVILTSGSKVTEGPFNTILRNAKLVLLGEVENDHLFAHLFMPDAWELSADNYGNPKLWHKVNPHIGITVQEDYYEYQWGKAQEDPEVYIEFVSKFLNIFHSDSVQEWIASQDIEAVQENITLPARPDTMASFDLSIWDDFSAVAYTSYLPIERIFYTDIDFYIPEETLKTHPNRSLYRYWVDNGFMKVCPGKRIDTDMIVTDILERNRNLRILQIGFDKWKAQETVNAISSAILSQGGDPSQIMHSVPQTYGAFTSPVESLEYALKSNPPRLKFSINPIIPYCFSNCYLDEDRMNNKKPMKRKRNLKIDGAICTLMNFWLFNNYEQTL